MNDPSSLPRRFDPAMAIESAEWVIADDIFVKTMPLARAGLYVAQHSHRYDHASVVASGAVRLWADGEFVGDFRAPKPIRIAAGVKHLFMALEHDTLVLCIHSIARASAVEILEEHALPGLEAR